MKPERLAMLEHLADAAGERGLSRVKVLQGLGGDVIRDLTAVGWFRFTSENCANERAFCKRGIGHQRVI